MDSPGPVISPEVGLALPFGDPIAYKRKLEELIAHGINVERYQAALDAIQRLPSETWEMKTAKQLRIEQLQKMLKAPEVDEKSKINISACVKMYKDGRIEFKEGMNYVVKAGELVLGPVEQLDMVEVLKDNQERDTWIEECWPPIALHTFPSFSTSIAPIGAPIGAPAHHYYQLRVRAIGSIPSYPLVYMDDTGASFPTIYEQDDLWNINIPPNYPYWGPWMSFNTANGAVLKQTILMEATVCDNTNQAFPIQPFSQLRFCVSPGFSMHGTRLGGPVLRSLLFQGTAPDGANLLYIAQKKTRLSSDIDFRVATIKHTHVMLSIEILMKFKSWNRREILIFLFRMFHHLLADCIFLATRVHFVVGREILNFAIVILQLLYTNLYNIS